VILHLEMKAWLCAEQGVQHNLDMLCWPLCLEFLEVLGNLHLIVPKLVGKEQIVVGMMTGKCG
jgi:hypothetical protein